MPAAMARRMNEDMNKVLALPDVQAKFDQFGAEDGGGTPEKFAEFIASEQKKWARICKEANVKLDS
jgi:tripartite-type tricarboxylate transporter receptor subunit TctC